MSESQIPATLACSCCGGRLEAVAKVYFDLTAAERGVDGELSVAGIELADLNDSFDGHPVAIESEFMVSCAECGGEVEARLAGAALARTAFHGAQPADPELLLVAVREIYHGARDGQAAVEAWARGPRIAPHVSHRHCEPCEATTPHIAARCAVCECGAATGAGGEVGL